MHFRLRKQRLRRVAEKFEILISSTLSVDIVNAFYEEISGEETTPVEKVVKASKKPLSHL